MSPSSVADNMLCDIEFINNPEKLYYTGSKIFVRVILKLEVEKTIEGEELMKYSEISKYHPFQSCWPK